MIKTAFNIRFNIKSQYLESSIAMLTRNSDIGILSVRLSVTFRYCIETA